jgi:hypothetical protein
MPVTARPAAERGIPLPEILETTGHARGSVRVVLEYYDLLELSSLVAGTLGPLLRAGSPRGGGLLFH